MNTFLLYLMFQADSIILTLVTIISLSLFALGACIIVVLVGKASGDDEFFKTATVYLKRCILILIIPALGVTFMPSTKTLVTIYGISTVADYMNSNEKAKLLPDKMIQVIDKKLDEILEEKATKK